MMKNNRKKPDTYYLSGLFNWIGSAIENIGNGFFFVLTVSMFSLFGFLPYAIMPQGITLLFGILWALGSIGYLVEIIKIGGEGK